MFQIIWFPLKTLTSNKMKFWNFQAITFFNFGDWALLQGLFWEIFVVLLGFLFVMLGFLLFYFSLQIDTILWKVLFAFCGKFIILHRI